MSLESALSQQPHKGGACGWLLSYNNARFLPAAVAGVLAQHAPLRLLFSDNQSQDGALDVLKQLAAESEREIAVQTGPGTGVAGHMNACMARTSEAHIVVFHDDDVSYPQRAGRLLERLQRGSAVVGSRFRPVNAEGAPVTDCSGHAQTEWGHRHLARGQEIFVFGCSMGFHRRVFDDFGPIPVEAWQEDIVIGFRGALLDRVEQLPEVLLDRRLTGHNASHFAPSSAALSFEQRLHAKIALHRRQVAGVLASHRTDLARAQALGHVGAALARRIQRRLIDYYQHMLDLGDAVAADDPRAIRRALRPLLGHWHSRRWAMAWLLRAWLGPGPRLDRLLGRWFGC